MKRVLQVAALLVAFALPAFCQNGRLSAHDQHEFDEAYTKWVKDSRKNDRDDVRKDEHKMQDIMQRNNIPADVPFDRVATNGNRYDNDRDRYNDQGRYDNGQGRYDNDRRDQERDRAYYESNTPRLSADDQHEFDQAYSKWVDDIRRNDRDDVRKDERRMQDIMARYNIPSDVPYDRIVSPNAERR